MSNQQESNNSVPSVEELGLLEVTTREFGESLYDGVIFGMKKVNRPTIDREQFGIWWGWFWDLNAWSKDTDIINGAVMSNFRIPSFFTWLVQPKEVSMNVGFTRLTHIGLPKISHSDIDVSLFNLYSDAIVSTVLKSNASAVGTPLDRKGPTSIAASDFTRAVSNWGNSVVSNPFSDGDLLIVNDDFAKVIGMDKYGNMFDESMRIDLMNRIRDLINATRG